MKTKINKISLGSLLGVLTIAIFAAVAWSVVAGNAFATEDETTTPELAAPEAQEAPAPEAQPAAEPTNDITQFSIKAAGLPDGVEPEIGLFDLEAYEYIDYKLGDYLEIESGAEATTKVDRGIVSLTAKDANHEYSFTICNPIGYDNYNVQPTIKISDKTDIVIQYQEYTGLYGVQVTVQNSSNQPIPGCQVKYLDTKWNLINTGTTGTDGTFTFTNLTKDQAVGIVVLDEEGYVTKDVDIDGSDYDKENHIAGVSLSAVSDSEAAVKLYSKDDNHLNFESKWEVSFVDDPTISSIFYYKLPSLAITAEPDALMGEWTVTPEGKLLNKHTVLTTIVSNYEINPIAKEGYTIDHWTIDKGDGNKFDVKPNDVFTLELEERLIAEAFYTNSPVPGPEPVPTPTPAEEVTATAQTGDSTAALPLAILAATCAIALVVSRKRA